MSLYNILKGNENKQNIFLVIINFRTFERIIKNVMQGFYRPKWVIILVFVN